MAVPTIFMMFVSVVPGIGEVQPFIRLSDGTDCSLMSPLCIAKAEIDYGPEIRDTARAIFDKQVDDYKKWVASQRDAKP